MKILPTARQGKAGPGRKAKQGQAEISRNHVIQRLFLFCLPRSTGGACFFQREYASHDYEPHRSQSVALLFRLFPLHQTLMPPKTTFSSSAAAAAAAATSFFGSGLLYSTILDLDATTHRQRRRQRRRQSNSELLASFISFPPTRRWRGASSAPR